MNDIENYYEENKAELLSYLSNIHDKPFQFSINPSPIESAIKFILMKNAALKREIETLKRNM